MCLQEVLTDTKDSAYMCHLNSSKAHLLEGCGQTSKRLLYNNQVLWQDFWASPYYYFPINHLFKKENI